MRFATKFRIVECFRPLGVGMVLAGYVEQGVVRENDELYIGPFEDGKFFKSTVYSIHRFRSVVGMVAAGESASIAIGNNTDIVYRKGIFAVHSDVVHSLELCLQFSLLIQSSDDAAQLQAIYQQNQIVSVHLGNIVQNGSISAISSLGGSVEMSLRFLRYPEIVNSGEKCVLRYQGRMVAAG